MEIEGYVRNIEKDIALMKVRIADRQKAGFHDMERIVESLVLNLFRAIGYGKIENKNLFKTNYPGIDLAGVTQDIELADDSPGKSIAVQVTTNATGKKIRKTISQFTKKIENEPSLADQYSTLYIVGFCRHSKIEVPDFCKVVGTDHFMQGMSDDASLAKAKLVLTELQRHIDYSRLHPWNDRDSLEIMLHTIDRSAVKHLMAGEGRMEDMDKAFKDLVELITTGKISDVQWVKPMVKFDDKIMKRFLSNVKDWISDIQSILYSSVYDDHGHYNLNDEQKLKIDGIKRKIAQASTDIAKTYKIDIAIAVKELSKTI